MLIQQRMSLICLCFNFTTLSASCHQIVHLFCGWSRRWNFYHNVNKSFSATTRVTGHSVQGWARRKTHWLRKGSSHISANKPRFSSPVGAFEILPPRLDKGFLFYNQYLRGALRSEENKMWSNKTMANAPLQNWTRARTTAIFVGKQRPPLPRVQITIGRSI